MIQNTGSAKTIESAGGVLENKVLEEGILTRRYWVPCADDFERKKVKNMTNFSKLVLKMTEYEGAVSSASTTF
mgnify:CR=1 FL=1